MKPLPAPLPLAPETIENKFLGVDVPFESARFVLLPLPYERTTSYKKGTRRGPAKFIEGSLGLELFDEELGTQTYRSGIHTLPDFPCDAPAEITFPKLEAEVRRLARMKDKTLFCIGGEHSLSQATIPAFAVVYPKLSVLHFDAHADLRSEYDGTRHSHACALYPISRTHKVVQIGIRSVAEEEAHLINAGNVTTFFMHAQPNVQMLTRKVLRALKDPVYISIDLDGFDPSIVPGVGTPQPGGFGWREALQIFRAVIENKQVVGVDIMELCPLQDTVQSELAAAKLAYRLMGYLTLKKARRA